MTILPIGADSDIDDPFSESECSFVTSKASNLEKQARDLSPSERARLALKLIESLDPGDDEDAEELWLDEAERRLREYEAGITVARPAQDAISEIRRKLK